MAKLVKAHTVFRLLIERAKLQASSKEARVAFDNKMGITNLQFYLFGDGDNEVNSKQRPLF